MGFSTSRRETAMSKKISVKSKYFTAFGTAIVRDGNNIDLEHFKIDCNSKNARDIKRIVCDTYSNVRPADVVIEKVETIAHVDTYVFHASNSELVYALIAAGFDYEVC